MPRAVQLRREHKSVIYFSINIIVYDKLNAMGETIGMFYLAIIWNGKG